MFLVGDIIKQNYQYKASSRLVIGYAPTVSDVLIVWDLTLYKIIWVHAWSHHFVSHTEITEFNKLYKLRHESHLKWILGSQLDRKEHA